MRQSFHFLLSVFILLAGCQPQNKLGKIMTPEEVWEYADKCGADPECYDTAADHYFQSLELSEDILAKGRFSSEVFNHFSEAIQLGNKKTALKILKNQTASEKYSLIRFGIYQVNSGLATPQSYITLLDFWDTDVLSGNMNRHDLIENWDIHHKDQRHKRNMKDSTSDLIGSIERLLRDDEINMYLPYIFETYSKKFLEQSKRPYWWVSKDREGLMIRKMKRRLERLGTEYNSNINLLEDIGWFLNENDAKKICNATESMLGRLLRRSDVSSIPNIERSLDAIFQGFENFVVYESTTSQYDDVIEAGFPEVVKASIERRANQESELLTEKERIPYVRMRFYALILDYPELFDTEIKEFTTLARETLSNQTPFTFKSRTIFTPGALNVEEYKASASVSFLRKYITANKLEADHADIALVEKWTKGSKPLPLNFKKIENERWDDFLTRIEMNSESNRLSYNLINMLEDHAKHQHVYVYDDKKNQHLVNMPALMERITPLLNRNERPEFLKALALAGDPDGAAKLFIYTANLGDEVQALFIAEAYAAKGNKEKVEQWILTTLERCSGRNTCSSYLFKRIIALGGMAHIKSENSPLFTSRRRIDKNLYTALLENSDSDAITAIKRHMEFQLKHDRKLDALPLIPLTATLCNNEAIKPLHRDILQGATIKSWNFSLTRATEALIENKCLELVDLAFEKVTPDFGKKNGIKDIIKSMIDNGHIAQLPKWFREQPKEAEIYSNFRLAASRLRLKQAYDKWELTQE